MRTGRSLELRSIRLCLIAPSALATSLFIAWPIARAQEPAPGAPPAEVAVPAALPAADPGATAAAPPAGEPPLTMEGGYAPIDEGMRAEQRTTGFIGLAVWTALAVGLGLYLAFRWKRQR